MNNYTFVGYKPVSYVSRSSGKTIDGYRLYFTYECDSVIGFATEEDFVSSDLFFDQFDCLSLGDKVVLIFNRYGHLVGCNRKEVD